MTEKEFQVGELIENRYRVLTVIGTGGMGTLYRVSDEAKDGEILALKTVRLNLPGTGTSESVERFQREFQLLTQLRHPNLVSVYDYGITAEGELYFTMEWIEGQDLGSTIRQIEPEAAIPVIVQICRALAYLHARGVIHGDLKPANVLITGVAGDQVKIVDFGVALEIRSPEIRARYYTPGYSAPEVKEQRPVDHRADLYSLGAMWYALLVGEPPTFMPGAGKERLIRFTLEEALEVQDQIPTKIGAVITRLLATSPTDRYGSANEVVVAVNRATGNTYQLETRETAESYALRTRFVNREAEMKVLQTLWEQAKSGEGKLVLISGESGVGKSRLVRELEVQAELEGARVVWGQCVESGGEAYHPWREVLRVLVRYVEGADEAAMQRVGPVLAALLPQLWERNYMAGLAPPAELDPHATQLRLNDGIVRVMRAAAGLRPTVIVVENMHWADEATLELLRYLARLPGTVGLLVCAIYRDDEVGAEHVLETLAGERVRLRRLLPQVTTDLACAMLGLETLPVLLTERLQQTTGGNAFFVQELIRSLAAEGEVLRRTVKGWQVDGEALRKAQLPESIRQVVERRLVQLSEEARGVLEWAAVVGSMFWEGSVAEVGQVARAQVRAALGELSDLGLIAERDETAFDGEREYLFFNPTVREVSYEGVSQTERREAHSRIAAWLLARGKEKVGDHLGLIADHLEGAGQTEQAAVYLRRAGEQAANQFANAEAIAYLGRALDLTSEKDWTRRYDLLLAREKVYDLQGMREAEAQDLATLEELAAALDDDAQPGAVGSRRAEVALRQATYAEAIGDFPAAIAAVRVTISLAQAVQDVHSEAAGYLQWGVVLWRQGEYDAARTQIEQSLRIHHEIGDRRGEGEVLSNLGIVFAHSGNYVETRACWEQALHIAREVGDRRGEGIRLSNLGRIIMRLGDYAEARAYQEQALRINRETGARVGECLALDNLGMLFSRQGDYARARAYYEQALGIYQEIGDRGRESEGLCNLSLLFHQMGDDEAAQEHSQQALLIAQEIGARRFQGYALTNLGHAMAGQDHLAEAASAYRQSLDIRRELGEPHRALDTLAGLARVFLTQGDLIQAQAQIEEVLSYLEGHTLAGTDEPFRVYLTCYRVLRANHDPRAQTILDTAYRLLQEQAAKISDEELRRSFLENVVAHQQIVREFTNNK